MMQFKNILWCAAFMLLSIKGYTQQSNSLDKIEAQIAHCIQKAMATSVYIIEYDTLKNAIKEGVNETQGFSGVVVSAAGHILTVSHAAVPEEVYQVRFPDGKRYIAKGLGRLGIESKGTDHDMAMLKIIQSGKWPYAEMGNTQHLHIGEALVSISYPSSFYKQQPNVRVGKVTDLDTSDGFISSTVKMEPGDSGGPLFDLYGRVVGIHSFINPEEDENFDVPVEFFLKYWTALQEAKDYTRIPKADVVPAVKKNTTNTVFTLAGIDNIKTIPANRTVAISSSQGAAQVHLLGTLISKGNQTFIVSKNAMVGDNPQASSNGKLVKLQVLHRDRENDVVLLQAEGSLGTALAIDNPAAYGQFTAQDLGRFLFSDLGNGQQKSGVLSAVSVDLPIDFSMGFCGASAAYQDGKIRFVEVYESDTTKTPLRKGDQVVRINNIPVKEAADYDTEFAKYLAGDCISLDLIRAGKAIQVSLYLLGQPTFRHVSFDYPGGRSERSDGYQAVLVQDAAIKSEECGGPVFDRNGQFYGINIARHSRTSTLIIPVSILNSTIENYLSTYKNN